MKKILTLLVVLSVIFTGFCFAAEEELKIFIWSEYMDPQIPKDFEKEFGIDVRIDLYESNEEMMAKLQAGGAGQYDIIVPSDYIMPSLINLDLLQKLDKSRIPNLKNLGDRFKETTFDPGNNYSAGWQWGTVGIIYDGKKLKDFDKSWSLMFDPKKDPGPFFLIDSVREMLGGTLLYLGYDFNSTNPKELKEAVDLLVKTKKRQSCMGFKGGVGGKNDVVAGVAVAAVVYNGDALQAVDEFKHLGFFVPKEGSEIWLDSMCIPAKAPNPDAAHKWINFILRPKVGAQLSNYNRYATPNKAALPYIKEEQKVNPGIYPTPEIMETLYFTKDLGKKNRLIDEAWTMVKSQ